MTITQTKLPSFTQAKKQVTGEEYRRYLQELRLVDITLEEIRCSGDRSIISPDMPSLSVEIQRTFKCQGTETLRPALLLEYVIQGDQGETKIIQLRATYRIHFEVSTPLPSEFFTIYSNVSADMQTWPFLRELASSITGRMGVPRLVLPLLLDARSLDKRKRSSVPETD